MARIYRETRDYVSKDLGVELSSQRIYRLFGSQNGVAFEARVGEPFERFCEPVVAIFWDTTMNLYHVCTPNRGMMRGVPYLFESREVFCMEDFEPNPDFDDWEL
jgi:hypothetical protein